MTILFSCLHLYSQRIAIELSIHWNNEEDPYHSNGDSLCVPYLDITYRNMSNEALYFLKVSQKENGFSRHLVGGRIRVYDGSVELGQFYDYLDYSKYHYSIRFDAHPCYVSCWRLLDASDPSDEQEIDPINDDLKYIYAYLSAKYFSPPKEEKIQSYLKSEITPDKILNELNDRFVFLKPGDIYIDTYNLVAFKLVKGTFTFNGIPDGLKDYVHDYDGVWDNNQGYIYEKIPLPSVVGEYKLYSDSVATNSITVTL